MKRERLIGGPFGGQDIETHPRHWPGPPEIVLWKRKWMVDEIGRKVGTEKHRYRGIELRIPCLDYGLWWKEEREYGYTNQSLRSLHPDTSWSTQTLPNRQNGPRVSALQSKEGEAMSNVCPKCGNRMVGTTKTNGKHRRCPHCGRMTAGRHDSPCNPKDWYAPGVGEEKDEVQG